MEDNTFKLIEHWKKHSPRPDEQIPFASIMNALGTDFAAVELREESIGRWGFHKRGSPDVAVFSFAGVIANADNMETGNLLPEGNISPETFAWRKTHKKANSWCFYTVVLDTSTDSEMFDLLKASEMDGFFTKHHAGVTRTRRSFMSGQDLRYNNRFWMQSPMFLPLGPGSKPPPPKHVHPWVAEAHEASKLFCANPSRPAIYGRLDGKVVPIDKCTPNQLHPGDIVSFAFTLVFHFLEKEWYPQYQPVELYVLKSAPAADILAYDVPYVERAPPATMTATSVEGILAGVKAEKVETVTPQAVKCSDDDDLYASQVEAIGRPKSLEGTTLSAEKQIALPSAPELQDESMPDAALPPSSQVLAPLARAGVLPLLSLEDGEVVGECEAPPLSQFKLYKRQAYAKEQILSVKPGSDDDTEKSTLSSISEDNDGKAVDLGERPGVVGSAGKKRGRSNGADHGPHDGLQELVEGKRKSKKVSRVA